MFNGIDIGYLNNLMGPVGISGPGVLLQDLTLGLMPELAKCDLIHPPLANIL